jgi:RNA polymerase sigma-70 factor (ECF subfamily)
VDSARTELLVRLLAKHQEDLFRYIFALLPHEEDARDVLQETSLALCRKFEDYDAAKPFLAWAFGFAHVEVMKQRERNQRGTRFLNREVLDHLMRERAEQEDDLQWRLLALEHCLEQLAPADHELIQQRYQGRVKMEVLIRQQQSSRRTFFRRLERIRRRLFECINRRMG